MLVDEKEEKEIILKQYINKVDKLIEKMVFYHFKNKKLYSFDYHFKKDFDLIKTEILKEQEEKPNAIISPSLKNKFPVFLPSQTVRISFFEYKSKSVRKVDIKNLKNTLFKQAQNYCKKHRLSYEKIEQLVKDDLEVIKEYDRKHNVNEYRRDIIGSTIQFNAYDRDDNLLLEKAFIKGGLVFDMSQNEFLKNVLISYPNYRKQRSDKKDKYLKLKLINIRAFDNT